MSILAKKSNGFLVRIAVAPLAGAWIEIVVSTLALSAYFVAPLAGAWIEILLRRIKRWQIWSLPSRERGLKFSLIAKKSPSEIVAPLAGAWIEIEDSPPSRYQIYVAPLAGAWIEMPCLLACYIQYLSLPSRERGLKFCLAE